MIRRATPEDAHALSALARACFTQTFGHLYAPGDLKAFLDRAYSPAVLAAELEDPQRATWLLFEGSPHEAVAASEEAVAASEEATSRAAPSGRHRDYHPGDALPESAAEASSSEAGPIGYVSACPAHLPHPEVAPGDGEVQRLYVLRDHQGAGRGTMLLNTALEWLEREGPRTLWIGVWSENYGAQRFYARHGFTTVGEYSFMVGDHADREFITRRAARASGPRG